MYLWYVVSTNHRSSAIICHSHAWSSRAEVNGTVSAKWRVVWVVRQMVDRECRLVQQRRVFQPNQQSLARLWVKSRFTTFIHFQRFLSLEEPKYQPGCDEAGVENIVFNMTLGHFSGVFHPLSRCKILYERTNNWRSTSSKLQKHSWRVHSSSRFRERLGSNQLLCHWKSMRIVSAQLAKKTELDIYVLDHLFAQSSKTLGAQAVSEL